MKISGSASILSFVLLSASVSIFACKSYKVKGPSFGEGAAESGDDAPAGDEGETAPEGDGEGDSEGDSADAGTGTDTAGAGTGASGGAAATDTIESAMIWNGSSFLGTISGEGYKIDAKTKKVTTLNKAIIGSQKSGAVVPITDDQISELMVIVAAAKAAVPKSAPSPCDKDKYLGEMHVVIVRAGVEETINNADVAKCEAKRYIDNASFEKINRYMLTTFPPLAPGAFPAPQTPLPLTAPRP